MTPIDANLTQRIVRRAKRRIAHDWRSRWSDYSTRIMKWGALVQGAWLLLPPSALAIFPKDTNAYIGLAMFLLGALAKLITEPGKTPDEPKE